MKSRSGSKMNSLILEGRAYGRPLLRNHNPDRNLNRITALDYDYDYDNDYESSVSNVGLVIRGAELSRSFGLVDHRPVQSVTHTFRGGSE